jgi:hypothetical protein
VAGEELAVLSARRRALGVAERIILLSPDREGERTKEEERERESKEETRFSF